MFDIDINNVKKGRRFYYIFLFIGILFFIIFGAIYVSNVKKLNSLDSTTLSTKVEVTSYIDDEGSRMYSPVYYYEVNGQSYSCSSSASSSNNPGTENKTVYYDSSNPSRCMSEYSKSSNTFIFIFLAIPVIFVIVAIVNIRKVNKKIKTIKELNQNGKLVKNLPYRLENSGIVVNNVPVERPVIDYRLSTGEYVTLYGEPRHDRKYADADGMVDLLIDESNPKNYFIDFEINRLTGNLNTDYYTQPQQNNVMNEQSQIQEQSVNNIQNI